MLQELKEKVTEFANGLVDDDTHIRNVLGRGEYPLSTVNFRKRMAEIRVPEEKISEIRALLGEKEREPNLLGPKEFEVERDRFVLTFKEGIETVQINAPVWDYDINLFVAVDEFKKKYGCRITGGELEEKIENLEEKLKKHRQLQKDLS